MNQTQLLAELASNGDIEIVGEPRYLENDEQGNPVGVNGLFWMSVLTLQKSPDRRRAIRKQVTFYVKDPGEPSEEAYFAETEPTPALTPEVTFANTVIDYIYANNLAQYAEVVNIDIKRMRALVTLYRQTSATSAEKVSALMWKPAGQAVQVRYLA